MLTRWSQLVPNNYVSRHPRTLSKKTAELPSSTHATTVTVAKITGGGDGGWNNVSLKRFSADQKIASSWEIMRFWTYYSTSNKLLLVARHILTTGLKKGLKLAV